MKAEKIVQIQKRDIRSRGGSILFELMLVVYCCLCLDGGGRSLCSLIGIIQENKGRFRDRIYKLSRKVF